MMRRGILACAAAALLMSSAPGLVQARQTAAVTASAPQQAAVTAPVARPAAAPAATVQPFAGPAAGSLLQTIFALCLVLGLLALLAWALKRYGPKAAGGSAHIRMVGGLNLGGRERIIVVEVGDQWIVVGASPGRVNALATMPRQGDGQSAIAVGGAGAQLHPHQKSASSFSDWLRQTIDKRNAG